MKLTTTVVVALALMSNAGDLSANPAVEYLQDLGWKKGSVPRLYTDTGWYADKYKNGFGERSYYLGRKFGLWDSPIGVASISTGLAKRQHLYYIDQVDETHDGLVGVFSFDLQWEDSAYIMLIPSKGIQLRFKADL